MVEIRQGSFVWDAFKEMVNVWKHSVDFRTATRVFEDPKRIVFFDALHSQQERRYFCIGKVEGRVLTVRFTRSRGGIRVIGAACWRKWRRLYEEKNG